MKFEFTRKHFNDVKMMTKDLLHYNPIDNYFYECHYFSQMGKKDIEIILPWSVYYDEDGDLKTYEEIKPILEEYINKRIEWTNEGKTLVGKGWDGEKWIEIWN